MAQRLKFAPRTSLLRQLRADVRRLAAGFGAGERVGDNLALVVDELVNNAIEHGAGYRRRNLDLELCVETDGHQLRLEFFDKPATSRAITQGGDVGSCSIGRS